MRRIRVIPTLLIDSNGGLVKTVRFGKRTYIGDPINAVKIFNDKGVDELVLLDIDATKDGREPNFDLIEDIVSEAFMPVGYGGGVQNIQQMTRLLRCGLEKIILCNSAHTHPDLIKESSDRFGSQSVVVCMDIKKSFFWGNQVTTQSGKIRTSQSPSSYARYVEQLGAGEILVYSIDRDGTFAGYDLEMLRGIAACVKIPVIACGGAQGIQDFVKAVELGGCSAVSAGSMFVYQGPNRGILISYPDQTELERSFYGPVADRQKSL